MASATDRAGVFWPQQRAKRTALIAVPWGWGFEVVELDASGRPIGKPKVVGGIFIDIRA